MIYLDAICRSPAAGGGRGYEEAAFNMAQLDHLVIIHLVKSKTEKEMVIPVHISPLSRAVFGKYSCSGAVLIRF